MAEVAARGAHAEFAPSRAWLAARIAGEARTGDMVLVMGARDPSLTGFAREILAAIEMPEGHGQERAKIGLQEGGKTI